jgi:hypothetical protein
MFNHLGCVNAEGQSQCPSRPAAVCPADYPRRAPEPLHLPRQHARHARVHHLALFAVLSWRRWRDRDPGRIAKTSEAVVPEGSLTVASFMENFVETFYGLLRDVLGKDDARTSSRSSAPARCSSSSPTPSAHPRLRAADEQLQRHPRLRPDHLLRDALLRPQAPGRAYLKHFIGPMPALAPLMIPLEIISHLVRPLSLAIRLCVNLFVDHMVVSVFTSLAFAAPPGAHHGARRAGGDPADVRVLPARDDLHPARHRAPRRPRPATRTAMSTATTTTTHRARVRRFPCGRTGRPR